MAWKGLHLTQRARLSLADNQMCVKQDAGEVCLALEDVAWIVIDTPQASFTSALMTACMEAGIAMVFTDERHTPSGLALPFHRHHRQGAVAKLQIAAKDSVKKRLWQTLVRAKISNQAAALAALKHSDAATLKEIARHVEPDDPDNVEARAARFYWGRLFDDFIRDDANDRRNKLLNYGYAVVRAGVARALVASGFLPAFGLKHDGAANAFREVGREATAIRIGGRHQSVGKPRQEIQHGPARRQPTTGKSVGKPRRAGRDDPPKKRGRVITAGGPSNGCFSSSARYHSLDRMTLRKMG
jgi:CRISPR-associated protein Cas1